MARLQELLQVPLPQRVLQPGLALLVRPPRGRVLQAMLQVRVLQVPQALVLKRPELFLQRLQTASPRRCPPRLLGQHARSKSVVGGRCRLWRWSR